MRSSTWTAVLTPIAIGLSFAVFRRVFPARVADPLAEPITDDERRVYRRWETGSLLPFFVFAPLLGYAWYITLKGGADLFHRPDPVMRFLVRPSDYFWGVPALFLGIITSAIPINGLYRILLRDRCQRFERYCNERTGFDGSRVLVFFAVLVFGGAAVFFAAGVTSFARFAEAGVEVGRPLSFRSRFYEYTRVRAIEHRATFRAPNGKTVQRPHYVILFDDGAYWSTREGCRDPVPEVDEPIVRFVSRLSGRAIVERP
jgi:hypothetical protein